MPAQEPDEATGVTKYSTVPDVVLLGLVSVWLIRVPDPGDAPVIPPVIAPTVHENVLGVVAVREIFGPVPLQVAAVLGVVTAGVGSTVTVMRYGCPTQFPVTDVGVTTY